MKQTAIDWLIEQLENQIVLSAHDKLGTKRTGEYRIGLRKAIDFCGLTKEMEKEQIIHAYGQGVADEVGEILDATKDAEQYYNQKYNSK